MILIYILHAINNTLNNTKGGSKIMRFKTKLWRRGKMSFATTIPHIVLLNLDPESKKYRVVWEYDEKIGKWTVSMEKSEEIFGIKGEK